MSERFSWVIDDFLAGMERPGVFQDFREDLEFLKSKNIGVIVNLEEYYRTYPGFEVLHIPIKDFCSPSIEDFNNFIDFIDGKYLEKKKVMVHCHAGMGRTNLMIASYLLKYEGLKPNLALMKVREKRPVYWITSKQENALWDFYYVFDS